MERPLSPGQEQKLRTDLDNFRKNPAKNQEKIERAETALQIHHDLITENTQHAVLRTLSSSQGMTMPNQPRYSIGQFPQQAEATDLQSQLSAMNHASGAAIDMGILHTLQHYKPIGKPTGRHELIMPMFHPVLGSTSPELDRKVSYSQEGMFRYLTLQRHFGLLGPINLEGSQQNGRPASQIRIRVPGIPELIDGFDPRSQKFLFDDPNALQEFFTTMMLSSGSRPGFNNILADTEYRLGQQPDTIEAQTRFYEFDKRVGTLPSGSDDQAAAFVESRNQLETLAQLMERDFVSDAEASDPGQIHRSIMGASHAITVQEKLCRKGWNVWLAAPTALKQENYQHAIHGPVYARAVEQLRQAGR